MATTADFKNGMVLEFNNDFYTLVEFQHVKPGKGGAFVRTKLKSLTNGRVLEYTFNAGVRIFPARVEKKKYQFLYKNDATNTFTFMHSETYEQIDVKKDMISNELFLKDGQEVYILYYAEKEQVLGVEFPDKIDMQVVEVEPGEKGNTVNRAMKRAKTETGLEVLVPLFIKENDVIKIDTRNGNYLERVKV